MKKIVMACILTLVVTFFCPIAFAQNLSNTGNGNVSQTGDGTKSDTGDGTKSAQTVSLPNPLGNDVTIPQLIGRVIKAILSIVGSLALVMFIYGGFTWMLAAGSSEKVKKGKDIIVWAAIGLIIIFSSYALVRFILTQLGSS